MSNNLQFQQWFKRPKTTFFGAISLWAIATHSFPIASIASPAESLPSEASQISQTRTEFAQELPVLRIQEIRGTGIVTINDRTVSEGNILESGQELVTGENTTVRLLVEGRGGSIEVSEYTRFVVNTLASSEIDLELFQGRARFGVVSLPEITSANPEIQTSIPATDVKTLDSSSGLLDHHREESPALVQNRSRTRNNYNFRVRTPTGVAGVRGTAFGVNVGPNGQTGVSTVVGSVVPAAQNQDRFVENGEYVTISPNAAPTDVELTPARAELKYLVHQTRSGDTLRIFGQVDRLDLVYINGEAIETDPEGKFAVIMERPTNRRLMFVLRGPAIRERVYEISVR